MAAKLLHFVSLLRTWLALVALMAFGNAVQCFMDPNFLKFRVYMKYPSNALSSRIFGCWTIILSVLRFCCAIDIYNHVLYNITLLSFVSMMGHLLSEVYYYKTASLTSAMAVQLTISGISVVAMVIGYMVLDKHQASQEPIEDFKDNRFSKLLKHKTN